MQTTKKFILQSEFQLIITANSYKVAITHSKIAKTVIS